MLLSDRFLGFFMVPAQSSWNYNFMGMWGRVWAGGRGAQESGDEVRPPALELGPRVWFRDGPGTQAG